MTKPPFETKESPARWVSWRFSVEVRNHRENSHRISDRTTLTTMLVAIGA
jgi:hypothetical protein